MSGHTYTHTQPHTYTHTHIHTYTHDNYYNPRCAHAHRGLIIIIIIILLYTTTTNNNNNNKYSNCYHSTAIIVDHAPTHT